MKAAILKYHYEEIVYALNIMATNMKQYHEEDRMGFSEAIHRFDTLSETVFLRSLRIINPRLNSASILSILHLKSVISRLFSSLWYKKLAIESDILKEACVLSNQLLRDLGEEYTEPAIYAEQKMEVSW